MLTMPLVVPVWSEPEEGVYLDRLEPGTQLEVRTLNHCYRIVVGGNQQMMISGHPTFCPEPVAVRIHGSTWGGSMLKKSFVGPGMSLEFRHPQHDIVTTSKIRSVHQVPPLDSLPNEAAPHDQDAA